MIPKSSLSNHFKVLREAGLIRSERHGVEMRNHSRWDEVEARFPAFCPASSTPMRRKPAPARAKGHRPVPADEAESGGRAPYEVNS